MEIIIPLNSEAFKTRQMTFERVEEAYNEKYQSVGNKLLQQTIDVNDFELYLCAYKKERELEIWARKPKSNYLLIETYKICKSSGKIGPKRKLDDRQVPEGFYFIDRFNPKSLYHLSLGINYPNQSDQILGEKDNLGGDIFIHGKCQTKGCLPMTDDIMKSIYIYAVEATNNGQENIPITIFPTRMTDKNYFKLIENGTHLPLYESLKSSYDYFEINKKLPIITFNEDGTMNVSN